MHNDASFVGDRGSTFILSNQPTPEVSLTTTDTVETAPCVSTEDIDTKCQADILFQHPSVTETYLIDSFTNRNNCFEDSDFFYELEQANGDPLPSYIIFDETTNILTIDVS